MRKTCVLVVDSVSLICVKGLIFYTRLRLIFQGVDKLRVFTSRFARVLLRVFHVDLRVFQSVNHYLLPTINRTYKDNNEVYINNTIINWRIG